MGKHDIKIVEVVVVAGGGRTVRGQIGEVAFEAVAKRWGRKTLMSVVTDGLDRGQRVAIGQAAWVALRKLDAAGDAARARAAAEAEAAPVEPLEMDGLR